MSLSHSWLHSPFAVTVAVALWGTVSTGMTAATSTDVHGMLTVC